MISALVVSDSAAVPLSISRLLHRKKPVLLGSSKRLRAAKHPTTKRGGTLSMECIQKPKRFSCNESSPTSADDEHLPVVGHFKERQSLHVKGCGGGLNGMKMGRILRGRSNEHEVLKQIDVLDVFRDLLQRGTEIRKAAENVQWACFKGGESDNRSDAISAGMTRNDNEILAALFRNTQLTSLYRYKGDDELIDLKEASTSLVQNQQRYAKLARCACDLPSVAGAIVWTCQSERRRLTCKKRKSSGWFAATNNQQSITWGDISLPVLDVAADMYNPFVSVV
ncbi:hypothetical protein EDD85DRAFT_935062 [Armillaria nabsnona]|nr:hypothetical protein EDD85DRAFT_935062 [Armillaria nabsnona]